MPYRCCRQTQLDRHTVHRTDAQQGWLVWSDQLGGHGRLNALLRRRSEQWQWVERLKAYYAALLDQINSDGHSQAVKRHEQQLKEIRDKQLSRAERVGELADELMALLKQSFKQQMDECVMLRSRKISSVLSAACKSLEGAMNIEATALGVAELLDQEFTNGGSNLYLKRWWGEGLSP